MIELGIFDKLNEWSEQLKEFMLNNNQNVVLFTGLFLAGIVIFVIAYNALHKEN